MPLGKTKIKKINTKKSGLAVKGAGNKELGDLKKKLRKLGMKK